MFWYPQEEDLRVRDSDGETLQTFLSRYNPGIYERPSVAVDLLVFRGTACAMEILLIRRGRHPYFGMAALPGGFIEMDESLEESAARELFEETGLTGLTFRQLGAYGDPGRDPRMRIISVAFIAEAAPDAAPKAGDDAADARFYRLSVTKIFKKTETIHSLRLENGQDCVCCTVAETGGKRVIQSSGLATDHAIMILDALERVGCADNK